MKQIRQLLVAGDLNEEGNLDMAVNATRFARRLNSLPQQLTRRMK